MVKYTATMTYEKLPIAPSSSEDRHTCISFLYKLAFLASTVPFTKKVQLRAMLTTLPPCCTPFLVYAHSSQYRIYVCSKSNCRWCGSVRFFSQYPCSSSLALAKFSLEVSSSFLPRTSLSSQFLSPILPSCTLSM